ncbi:unnamed protein product [Pylaiella littoralis]
MAIRLLVLLLSCAAPLGVTFIPSSPVPPSPCPRFAISTFATCPVLVPGALPGACHASASRAPWEAGLRRGSPIMLGMTGASDGEEGVATGQAKTKMEALEEESAKKKRLSEEEGQLREKRLLLLKRRPPTADSVSSTSADKRVADFSAELTRAEITENTLALVDGTFFLGEESLGCKLFIRPSYKKLSELILDGGSEGTLPQFVVTGTPGIGKSVFGLYLLSLLRCRGKTVVFERKSFWFRFSDEGVDEGDYSSFKNAGYLHDENTWYLSDPEEKPEELLRLATVVMVSPTYERTKEFLKLRDSEQVFMPVWELDELFECREAVFPHVPRADVAEYFRVVGGVPRAVFNDKKFVLAKRGLEYTADKVHTGQLPWVDFFSKWQHHFQPDEIGDELFHIFSDSSDDFKTCTVSLASDYARDLVFQKVTESGKNNLLAVVRVALENPSVTRLLGEDAVDAMFKEGAHQSIGGVAK